MQLKKIAACTALGVTLLSAGTYSSANASANENINQQQIQVVEGDAVTNPNAKVKAIVNGAKYLGGWLKESVKLECRSISKFVVGGIEENSQTTHTEELEVLFDQ
ncbi:hypothetical protein ACIGEL_19175 [Rossellomorea aquimaris]|uniref:hypothetical protein n=1 Tax=Rossellomorea aquimaris TaxID=189382 RepID=UPI0037CC84A1